MGIQAGGGQKKVTDTICGKKVTDTMCGKKVTDTMCGVLGSKKGD
jgi:hypothetical protein